MMPLRNGVARLIPLLNARRPLLVAGAGTSADMGYPLWSDLVQRLAEEFSPELVLSDDKLADVDRIASVASKAGRSDEYFKRLDQTFSAQSARHQELRFHRRLISLGFSGLATLNFDLTLERACIAEYSNAAGIHRCEPIDLTADRPYLVYDFLRNLGASPRHDCVLHLHGLHSAPKRMILGRSAYENAYGHDLSGPDANLRTLPRKVLWALLATRPVLFVGFSMTDPFFESILNLVRDDFILTDELAHFSIFPYEVDLAATTAVLDPAVAHEEAKKKIQTRLPRWLVPIFYHAPRVPATGRKDHGRLAALIEDLGSRGRTAPRAESTVDRLARRTLEEL